MAPSLYIVEAILEKRIVNKKVQYKGIKKQLVKWQGFDISESTWEPLTNLEPVIEMVRKFDKQQEKEIVILSPQKNSIDKKKRIQKYKKDNNTFLIKEKGSFQQKDIPHCISNTSYSQQKEILFEIEWEPRSNSFWPENTVYTQSELRKYDPEFLLDFYESKLCLKQLN